MLPIAIKQAFKLVAEGWQIAKFFTKTSGKCNRGLILFAAEF